MTAIAPDRWIFCRTQDEANRWNRATASEGLQVTIAIWGSAFRDDRGNWQPPRVFWRDYKCPKCNQVFHIYWIDGFWFRNNLHIDYSEGGHHWVYPEIPEDCIYLEPSYLEHTKDEEIVGEHHESPERCDMEHIHGCFYEEAHGCATREERGEREEYREVPAPQQGNENETNSRTRRPDRPRGARMPMRFIW
jgi:hypothetical protein